MKITITIETENAAFEGNANAEVAQILRRLALRIDDMDDPLEPGMNTKLRDTNGNTCGEVAVEAR